jgi:tetratricopeptide (TPR) repeat protein
MTISHSPLLFLLLLLVFALSACSCRSADENRAQQERPSAPHHPAGVSPSKPSPSARLTDGIGHVDFAITTKSKDAQAFFNQGIAQLYGFWFIEAERSFLEAARLDPTAAMAYWGIAMAAPGNFLPMYQLVLTPSPRSPAASPDSPESRARAAIVKARVFSDSITPRERLYIEAVAAHHDSASRDPDAAYIAVMRKLVESFPDDLEAKAILALALENGYDPSTKSPKAGTAESLRLLRQVLAKDPNHVAANHFLIHGLEGSKNLRSALRVANRYAALAPNIPHVLHMPGHVYAQIGMFDEAVKAFLAAAAKEHEYMSADPHYSKLSYVHNEILLLHVLGSQGRYRDAMSRIADLMSAKENLADRETAEFFYRVGWFALMKTLVRFEKWDEILDGKTLPFYNQPPESLWYHWARGLAYASASDAAGARNSLQMMEQLIRSLERVINPIPPQFQIAHSELAAYIEATTGDANDVNKGLDELNRAAMSESLLPYTDPTVYPRPVLELLGKTALKAREFHTAEPAFRRALENEPGSGRALWGLAKTLEGLGRKAEAEKIMQEFRRVWRGTEIRGQ